jgi:hypothetical protein
MADTLRKGIIHPKDLRYEHAKNLVGNGSINGEVTEKTDGAGFEVGHGKEGFFVRSSRSPKIAENDTFERNAREKFGDDFDPTMSRHYDKIKNALAGNKNLREYLKSKHEETGEEASMKGEMFYKPFSSPAEDGGIKFVGTSYDPSKMGKLGSFVMHSKSGGNEGHDPEHVKNLGDENFNIDHDVVENGRVSLPAKDLKEKLEQIDPDILTSRKKEHAEAKAKEQAKLANLNSAIEQRVRTHTDNLQPKWGNETEGHVFHPDAPDSTKFKLTSPTFKAFKAAQKQGNM